ncbi:TadE/TadG family type IV pilus assembly protein [Sanguibacter sp. A247]|uniref:TadE/TadG family type IV pilus assembly protein n=1 Tax=unclassified Sanguibacter TaxID=2645534 RepID=UPI003FD7EA39
MRILPRKRARHDEGYLIVEAAVALPLYVAFMLIILSISSWAIAQAQVTVALNQTAMEISQYRYVRTTTLGADVDAVKQALDDFSRGLGGSGDAFGTNGSENPLSQAFNGDARAGAKTLLNKHLSGSDASLAAMGVVGGANGVDLTADTSVDDERVVLDAEYTLRVLFFWDITVDMRAHAETGVWGGNE